MGFGDFTAKGIYVFLHLVEFSDLACSKKPHMGFLGAACRNKRTEDKEG